jgi:hypothetical protein
MRGTGRLISGRALVAAWPTAQQTMTTDTPSIPVGGTLAKAYGQRRDTIRPLPGACELLASLTNHRVPWAIATSGLAIAARPALDMLGLPADTLLVTWDQVRFAKPDPDLFLAAQRVLVPTSARPSSSATASGTCSPLDGPAPSGSACFLAVTEGGNALCDCVEKWTLWGLAHRAELTL